ncbi:replication protein A [Mute swan feces associated circular virus 8]|nr:replication protein A [Mute swan feces associated circular virus 8]
MQVCRWVFTLNNFTEQDVLHLSDVGGSLAANGLKYLVFGREVGDSGTPHLQGFAVFTRSLRLTNVRALISARGHFEAARGSNEQASTYCKKDGDFEEYGSIVSEQGKRNDFESFKQWVLDQPDKPTASLVALQFPGLYLKYGRIMEWIDLIYPVDFGVGGELRPWQRSLETDLMADPDDRRIYFVVDTQGGQGKTWFVRYWMSQNRDLTQILSIGKRDDLAYVIDESKRYFLFDVPRSCSEFLQYSVLEKLKDRVVFSPKYGSRTKFLNHLPHVVVFMNEHPDMTKLSRDRYVVLELDN